MKVSVYNSVTHVPPRDKVMSLIPVSHTQKMQWVSISYCQLFLIYIISLTPEKKKINPSKDTLFFFFKGEAENVRQVICIISHSLDLNVGLLTSLYFRLTSSFIRWLQM